jgi:hypothetical protein
MGRFTVAELNDAVLNVDFEAVAFGGVTATSSSGAYVNRSLKYAGHLHDRRRRRQFGWTAQLSRDGGCSVAARGAYCTDHGGVPVSMTHAISYDAGKGLNAAAKTAHEAG